jgi:outer membrane protein TolC
MMNDIRRRLLAMAFVLSLPATGAAQATVTLEEAMSRARTATPEARAAAAAVEESAARVEQARSRFFPRVDVTGSVQRGNQPVYVFSSTLSQRRFTQANFDLPNLNHPDPVTNIRTAVSVNQSVYDGGANRVGVSTAQLQQQLSSLDQARATHDLALGAARAFIRVLQFEAAARASTAAVTAADSDLDRTRRRRDVGLVTDADVLAVEVHLADVRQQQIATGGELDVARVELANAIGLPLDEPIVVARPASSTRNPDAAVLVREALTARPELRQAEVRERLAENDERSATAAFLPHVAIEGAWEFNGGSWATQRSGWIVGGTVALNVFNGFADRARRTEARHMQSRAAAEREQVERRIEVEVRGAVARLTAAQARATAGMAALTQARESQRIIRDRYEAGLTSVTDMLRAAEAVLDAESRATAADMDAILEAIALDRAVGRL